MDDKLKFNEEVMLALYLEVFKEYYNKGETKYCEDYNMTINEGKMQSICYIFQKLGLFDEEYGFSLNWYIPYSPGIMSLQNDIDRKQSCVDNFYDEYYEKRKKLDGIYTSLSKYYSQEQIDRVINATNILEELSQEQLGIELLSTLHFTMDRIYDDTMERDYYKDKIEESYPIYTENDDLFQKSCSTLNALNLINKPRTKIPQRVKIKKTGENKGNSL